MKKIDAHNHPGIAGYDCDMLVKNMDGFGISKTVLLSCETPVRERHISRDNYDRLCGKEHLCMTFEECLGFYEKYPDRFILGYAPDPRDPLATEKLKKAVKDYDVRLCGEFKYRVLFDDPDVIDYFRECGNLGLPVTVHIDYHEAHRYEGFVREKYWYGGDMDNFERALIACPDTVFFGHATLFWAHISNDELWRTEAYPQGEVIPGGRLEQMMEKYHNLYIDASAGSALNAMKRDVEYTKYLFERFQDRIVFGRDNEENFNSEFVDSLGLSESILEKFYYKNIENILKL